ncbi:unnamed protein product [Linum tenue]|uniref:Erythromycin biosynthesis protein CIII-like C-terminal domain-containing protein n=1 Tax=Linum tenue TaxID=586396 RepID=A0AAV0IB28_9ROSI|nr:unnamed protein product [Linum tenue]CAI0426658.1 unnamed protein product [Linum tenue]
MHADLNRESPELPAPTMQESAVIGRSSSASSSSSSTSVEVQAPSSKSEIGTATSGSSVNGVQVKASGEAAGSSSSGGGGSVNNGGAATQSTSSVKGSEPTSNHLRLERSKTERQRHHNILAEDAAQIFDNKIPVQQKLQLLNRIATVKDNGTVEFEVPGDVEPQTLGLRGEDICSAATGDEPLDGAELQYIPPLQIVMLIVGTRGDVQPFIAIGKRLQNKGFLPSGPSEIPVQRNQLKDIIWSLLPACKEPDIDSGIPFKADAMIANPPAYGEFVSLEIRPTSEFPHPLSRVKQPAGYRLSYQIVDSLIWLGIRDMINDVRKKKLKLRPVTYLSGSQGSEFDVPHAYIWSPHLVPKPKDWGPRVDVVGFCFLDLASNFEPPEELVKWLKAGPKPIYIGFGSLPVQEPEKMTQIIVEALEQTGQRGIINKGWGGLGNLAEPKDSIYLLDNIPHDWLFLQCKAVVHHGGAGTTAAGLKAACPTTIVPFFGDQPFWGERVHARGVGPPPIQVEEFSLTKLVEAVKFMLDPQVKERAVELAKAMENEDGVDGAVRAFLKHLPRKKKGEPDRVAEPSSVFSFGRCFGCS